jgi:hypothetical protein
MRRQHGPPADQISASSALVISTGGVARPLPVIDLASWLGSLVALHRGFDRLRREFSGCTAPAHPSLACGLDALKQRLYDIGRKFLEELDREDRPRCALLKPRPPPAHRQPPIKVTFDTNTLSGGVDPDQQADEAD